MTIRTQLASLILIACALLLPALAAAQTSTTLTASRQIHRPIRRRPRQSPATPHHLQQAVAKHDAAAVAALVHYPIKVNPGKKPFTVKNEKAFIKDYDRIITPDIAAVIFKQKYENLFVNSQGAMIGDGEVWITGFCRDKSCKHSDIKIGTIQDTKNLKP